MASFTEVFGGATLYPAGQTYLSLTFSADQVLQWPIEQAIAGENVVSSIMDLNATGVGLNVDFPDARQVSNGVQSVFNNIGANDVTIRDAAGGTILSAVSGTAFVLYLADNSTIAGTWRVFELGAGVTQAQAALLAGAGLKAQGPLLSQRIAPTSTAATPITWTDANRAQLTIWTGGVGVLDLPTAATVGSDWFSMVRNGGSGDLTLTPPAGLIDTVAVLALAPGESAIVITDGTNFFTVGLGQSASGVFDFVEINVAGSGDFVLSGVQLNRIAYRFIGALTGDRNIVVPNTAQQYWVDNSTTGAFSLFVNTVGQITPVEIQQLDRNITYCDGNNILQAESATVGFPIAIGQGGTGAITAPTALSNLGAVPLTRLLNTNVNEGLSGGGDLTADRNFALDVDNLTLEATVDLLVDTLAFFDDSAGAMRKTLLSNVGGLAIEEEGVPLVAIATALNFIGGIVTAAGAGATKTITIPIEASTGADNTLRGDGAGGWAETVSLTIQAGGNVFVNNATFSILSGTDGLTLSTNATVATINATGTSVQINMSGGPVRLDQTLFMLERAAALADVPGDGQVWVRNNTPNDLFFTDDSGTDFPIAYADPRVTLNSSFNFNTASNEAYNRYLYWDDGGNATVTLEDSGSVVNWPVGVSVEMSAPGTGVITIAEGAGTTLFTSAGADTVGGGTLTLGTMKIFRASAANYIIIRENGFT